MTSSEAAKRIGVSKNTLYQWEVRQKAGDPRYVDFPSPLRILHTNHRIYTDDIIERIREWKDRTK